MDEDEDTSEISLGEFVSHQLEKRVLDYSNVKSFSVFSGTWNVNGKNVPPEESAATFKSWLRPSLDLPLADIYVIALEEIVDLNVINTVVSSSSSDEKANQWMLSIKNALNVKSDDGPNNEGYSMVIEKHMVGLLCGVFVRDNLLNYVSDMRFSLVATGAMVGLGNKGGIAVHMNLYDSPLCFVAAHFHPNRDVASVEARNLDFQTIYETAEFTYCTKSGNCEATETETHRCSEFQKKLHDNAKLSVAMHDHIIWIGDLNYRIHESIDTQEVFDKIAAHDWESLLEKDQLNLERANDNVFLGFSEGAVCFPPTYKYQPGTDEYEIRPGRKIRAPAWCDRVLWKSKREESIKLLNYRRAEVNFSDHRPVSAYFQCEALVIQDEKLKSIYQELLTSMDKMVNAAAPCLELEGRIIDTGAVTANKKIKKVMTVKNSGPVIAQWSFVPKGEDQSICQNWLKIKPLDGILGPDEKSVIEVTINFTDKEACAFFEENGGNHNLDDILIFRVKNGSDLFCIISGAFEEGEVNAIKMRVLEEQQAAIEEENRAALDAVLKQNQGLSKIKKSRTASMPLISNAMIKPGDTYQQSPPTPIELSRPKSMHGAVKTAPGPRGPRAHPAMRKAMQEQAGEQETGNTELRTTSNDSTVSSDSSGGSGATAQRRPFSAFLQRSTSMFTAGSALQTPADQSPPKPLQPLGPLSLPKPAPRPAPPRAQPADKADLTEEAIAKQHQSLSDGQGLSDAGAIGVVGDGVDTSGLDSGADTEVVVDKAVDATAEGMVGEVWSEVESSPDLCSVVTSTVPFS